MTLTVSVPEEFSVFLDAQVATGLYVTHNDVACEALRQMKARIEWLQQAYQDGLDSGLNDGPLDIEAIKAEGRARLEKFRK